jgi:hypothetical protein
MPSLHIEHAVTDFATWTEAFGRFAEARRTAGVRGEHIRRPVDDPAYVVVDLEFDTVEAAEAFLGFLTTAVWAVPDNSPGLSGRPEATVLETVMFL